MIKITCHGSRKVVEVGLFVLNQAFANKLPTYCHHALFFATCPPTPTTATSPIFMETLRHIWPVIVNIGAPFLAIVGAFVCYSLNFYWRACNDLRHFEEYIKKHHTVKGYHGNPSPAVGIADILYGFKSASTFDQDYLKHRLFIDAYKKVFRYRSFYRIAFPVLLLLGCFGMLANECIIDN